MQIFSLLDYLDENKLIYLYPISESIGTDDTIFQDGNMIQLNYGYIVSSYFESVGYSSLNEDSELIGNSFLEGEKFKYLFENLFYSIIPTPELIEFVDKKFEDKEQKRHEDNLALQKEAIVTAS